MNNFQSYCAAGSSFSPAAFVFLAVFTFWLKNHIPTDTPFYPNKMWNFEHTGIMLSVQVREIVEDVSPVFVWGFIAVTALVIVVDIFLYTNKVQGDTISIIIRDWVYGKWFVLSFVWGVLATHFFLTGPFAAQYANGWMIIGLIILGMVIAGWFFRPQMTPFTQAGLLVFGVLASFVLTF